MRKDYEFYVYIVANRSRTLYIGVTRNLRKRVAQHRDGDCDGFTKRYNINRLVYFERFTYVNNAITREKELKGWLREKKLALINAENPTWVDLYETLFLPMGEQKQILRFAQDDNVEGETSTNVRR
jgi:putative endonuclease